jgi:hypothetical protein
MPKVIVAPGELFAARIASRREMRPSAPGFAMRADTDVVVPSTVSAVVVTTRCPTAWTAPPNSEVLFEGSVAVAVTYSPAFRAVARVTPKTALLFPTGVLTFAKPR